MVKIYKIIINQSRVLFHDPVALYLLWNPRRCLFLPRRLRFQFHKIKNLPPAAYFIVRFVGVYGRFLLFARINRSVGILGTRRFLDHFDRLVAASVHFNLILGLRKRC